MCTLPCTCRFRRRPGLGGSGHSASLVPEPLDGPEGDRAALKVGPVGEGHRQRCRCLRRSSEQRGEAYAVAVFFVCGLALVFVCGRVAWVLPQYTTYEIETRTYSTILGGEGSSAFDTGGPFSHGALPHVSRRASFLWFHVATRNFLDGMWLVGDAWDCMSMSGCDKARDARPCIHLDQLGNDFVWI